MAVSLHEFNDLTRPRALVFERIEPNSGRRGLLEMATISDGMRLTCGYDNAHRLTGITDHKGNRIDNTLDPMGNRTAEQLRDPAGTPVKNIARVIDALNRIERTAGSVQ